VEVELAQVFAYRKEVCNLATKHPLVLLEAQFPHFYAPVFSYFIPAVCQGGSSSLAGSILGKLARATLVKRGKEKPSSGSLPEDCRLASCPHL